MESVIELSCENHVARLTFNRPGSFNALNHEMIEQLVDKTSTLCQQDDIKLLLLQGAGSAFLAGGDIHFFYENLDHLPGPVPELVTKLNHVSMNLRTMPAIVLACVHGAVAGAGMSLMLACDLVLASDNTKFTFAYSKIATTPDGGATYFLPRLVGSKKAMELLLFSDTFDAQSAKQWGLINWVVPDNEFNSAIQQHINRIIQGPTQTFKQLKQLVYQSEHLHLKQQLEEEMKSFTTCSQTDDFRIGVSAFVNKEKTEFKGE